MLEFSFIFCMVLLEALVLRNKYFADFFPGWPFLFVNYAQVPYLDDPNTGVKMFESAEIIDYLRATYAL